MHILQFATYSTLIVDCGLTVLVGVLGAFLVKSATITILIGCHLMMSATVIGLACYGVYRNQSAKLIPYLLLLVSELVLFKQCITPTPY